MFWLFLCSHLSYFLIYCSVFYWESLYPSCEERRRPLPNRWPPEKPWLSPQNEGWHSLRLSWWGGRQQRWAQATSLSKYGQLLGWYEFFTCFNCPRTCVSVWWWLNYYSRHYYRHPTATTATPLTTTPTPTTTATTRPTRTTTTQSKNEYLLSAYYVQTLCETLRVYFSSLLAIILWGGYIYNCSFISWDFDELSNVPKVTWVK